MTTKQPGRVEDCGSIYHGGKRFFSSPPCPDGPAVGSTQPPNKCLQGALTPGVKQLNKPRIRLLLWLTEVKH
jgi:hypothetical protein